MEDLEKIIKQTKSNDLQRRFSSLSRWDKGIIIGSGVLAISFFLPWFADLSAYGVGDAYFGFNGPMMVLGILVFLCGAVTFLYHFMPLMRKGLPKLPINKSSLALFLGVQSALFLVIANSIFFHQKFGVNITLKEAKIGMLVAVVGTVIMTFSSYFKVRGLKKQRAVSDTVGKQSSLIDPSDVAESNVNKSTERKFSVNHQGKNMVDKATEVLERQKQSEIIRKERERSGLQKEETKTEPSNIENMRIRMDL